MTNIPQSFYLQDGGKNQLAYSYGTKLRHCHGATLCIQRTWARTISMLRRRRSAVHSQQCTYRLKRSSSTRIRSVLRASVPRQVWNFISQSTRDPVCWSVTRRVSNKAVLDCSLRPRCCRPLSYFRRTPFLVCYYKRRDVHQTGST